MQLCRKDMLMKNVRKHKRQLQKSQQLVEEDWNFLPLTFFLPSEYIMFAEEFRKQGGLWIMKPTSRCQGQGIFIIDKLAQVAPYRHKAVPPPSQPPPQTTPQPAPRGLPPKVKREDPSPKEEPPLDGPSESEEEERGEEGVAESYLIQQYISRPLLLGSKKFDLRIYCLCTNYSQLTAWLYRSGFARFTHEPYNAENIGNLESHLTNVEIQKHSENYD
jgi:tubulin polyglutamylase TTLL9